MKRIAADLQITLRTIILPFAGTAIHKVGHAVGCFGAVFFDCVNVIVKRGGYAGMAQQFGYRCDVNAVCDVIGCAGVPEHMGMDMPKSVPFGKFTEPSGNTVRMNRFSVVAGKHETRFNPAVAVDLLQKKLFLFMEFQKLHRFLRDKDISDIVRFRGRFHDAVLFGINQRRIDFNTLRRLIKTQEIGVRYIGRKALVYYPNLVSYLRFGEITEKE